MPADFFFSMVDAVVVPAVVKQTGMAAPIAYEIRLFVDVAPES
jgi:hypothetical protein